MRRLLDAIFVALFAIQLGLTVAAFFEPPWPLILVQNFAPHMLAGGAVFALVVLVFRRYRLAAAAVLTAAVSYAPMTSVRYITPSPAAAGETQMTVVWANVHRTFSALEQTLAYGRAQDADLIMIGAFPFRETLTDDLAPDYPHRLDTTVYPPGAHYAERIVVFSRLPLIDPEIVPNLTGENRVFARFAVAPEDGARLNVIATHPFPPQSADDYRRQAEHAALVAASAEPPFLIAGDLNATPWSSMYRRFPGRRIGDPKWTATWSPRAHRWAPDFLTGLPLDHFRVSEEVNATAFEIGPAIDSDHRPISARLSFGD